MSSFLRVWFCLTKVCILFHSPEIPEEQAGFVTGGGTEDQILNIWKNIEEAFEFNITAYMCFVDYGKAFYCVKWNKISSILEKMEVPQHVINRDRGLNENNKEKVRINNNISNKFDLKARVRGLYYPLWANMQWEKTIEPWVTYRRQTNNKSQILKFTEDETNSIIQKIEMVSRSYTLKLNKSKQLSIEHP